MNLSVLCEKSILGNKWVINQQDYETINTIQTYYNLSYLTASVLANRNIQFDEIADFLDPKLKNAWINPKLLANLEKASDLIIQIIAAKQKIGILGDYDVDGVSSAAIWHLFFKHYGIDSVVWLPNRQESYGPTNKAATFFSENKVDLLMVVDCGTNSIDFMNNIPMPAIIIDHHITSCYVKNQILINPHTEFGISSALEMENLENPIDVACIAELKNLCASALSFLLISDVLSKKQEDNGVKLKIINEIIDLAAYATICDVMHHTKLNRAIISKGLNKKQHRIGIQALVQMNQLTTPITSNDIGYYVGPQLNAAGRMRDAKIAFELLITNDANRAFELASILEQINSERKTLQEVILNQVLDEITANCLADAIIIVASANWHLGVIGIVAACVVERFKKPAVIGCITQDEFGNEIIKASARSQSVHIGNLITKAIENGILQSGGGHKAACGFVATLSEFENFKKWTSTQTFHKEPNPIKVDAIIELQQIHNDYMKIMPYGPSNEDVTILSKNLTIKHIAELKKSYKIILEQNSVEYIFFIPKKMQHLIEKLKMKKIINALIKLGKFNNIIDFEYI